MTRRDHTFLSGGLLCAARLYTPGAPDGPRPCVVMAHGLDGAGNARLAAFARRFADAGMAALVFDYRHFGHSEGEPRRLVDRDRQLEDWRAAINFTRMLHGIDARRVAVWGTSLSAGHVATIAADDPEIAAAISQAPLVSGLAALRAAGARAAVRIALADLRDHVRGALGRPPSVIPLVGPPGSLAAMTSPDAEPGYRALFEPGDDSRNEATARGMLRLAAYRPAIRASEIQCPWLVCVCDGDAITPPRPAVKAAARAPRGEIRHYGAGHFDIYVGPTFEIAASDQVDFLRRHLLGDGGGQPALR
jgi:dienelactone hydrolase